MRKKFTVYNLTSKSIIMGGSGALMASEAGLGVRPDFSTSLAKNPKQRRVNTGQYRDCTR